MIAGLRPRALACGLLLVLASGCSPVPADKPAGRDSAPAARALSPATPSAPAIPVAANADNVVELPQAAPKPKAVGEREQEAEDLPPSNAAVDPEPFPPAVTEFMVERDGCDHFRGEDAYDADRRVFLDENMRQLCTGTDARLADLRSRYAGNRDVTAALHHYDDRIETHEGQ
ncbi:hypothetical protein BH10PSE12_BH10PSE12_03370 [soil metagenome]